jgi:hypothetical protein
MEKHIGSARTVGAKGSARLVSHLESNTEAWKALTPMGRPREKPKDGNPVGMALWALTDPETSDRGRILNAIFFLERGSKKL